MDQREEDKIIEGITHQEYKEGFVTDVKQDFIPKGLNEYIIRMISSLDASSYVFPLREISSIFSSGLR